MTAAKRMPADSTDWGSESDSPPAPMTVKDAQKAHEVIKPYLAATPLLEIRFYPSASAPRHS